MKLAINAVKIFHSECRLTCTGYISLVWQGKMREDSRMNYKAVENTLFQRDSGLLITLLITYKNNKKMTCTGHTIFPNVRFLWKKGITVF